MSKGLHIAFVIISIIFIIIAFINLVAVTQSEINLSVEESTLPSCISDTEDLISTLTMKYVWEMMFWIVLGTWHFIQFLED